MGLPLQLRLLFSVGAALGAFPAIAMADPTRDPSSVGDRTVMTRPVPSAATAPIPLDLPAPATVVQANAAAAEGFKDVPAKHWAYPALQQLQIDGIVLGYPDGTFRGRRRITRYELAAITARAIKQVQTLLADAATAPKVSPEDIATLRKLIDDNTTQLAAVQKDVGVLKTQTALNTDTLNRQPRTASATARLAVRGLARMPSGCKEPPANRRASSATPIWAWVTSTPAPTRPTRFINNPNGHNIAYVGVHHYFATNAQIGLILQGWSTFTNLPIGYGTDFGTPGIVTRDRGQAICLETRLAF